MALGGVLKSLEHSVHCFREPADLISELEELADELVVLREGKVLASGPLLDLLKASGLQPRVRIEASTGTTECGVWEVGRAIAGVKAGNGTVHRIVTTGATLSGLYAHLHQPEDGPAAQPAET
ncbi:MAG: hypothetical protein ACRDIU_03285 [Actinomycetota bacterium]